MPGSSCGTVSPSSREACCKNKKIDGVMDEWCAANYPDPAPTPVPTPAPTPVPKPTDEKNCKDSVNINECCIGKALKGELTDPACINDIKKFDWMFWGGIIIFIIILCIVGYFVYQKYFANKFVDNANFGNDNFGNDNFGNDNFGNDLGNDNFGNDLGNDNFGDDLGNDNFGDDLGNDLSIEDLEIINMPPALPTSPRPSVASTP